MGINSTEVSYGFGQLGSVYTSGGSVKPPTNKVFVAITMLEDTKFDGTGGLVASDENKYFNTDHPANDLDAGLETTDEGSGGGEVPSTVVFPKGITIYGRYTEIDVTTGKCIAYIGD